MSPDENKRESGWRAMSVREIALLSRLLDLGFEGSAAMRIQADRTSVRVIDEYKDNYGSIEFEVSANSRAPQRCVISAMARDTDGVPILLNLFEQGGDLSELEVVKLDGTPILRLPEAPEFTVPGEDRAV